MFSAYRVFRLVTRNLDFRTGYTWKGEGDWRVAVEKIPWQERAAFAPHGVRSLCFASCP